MIGQDVLAKAMKRLKRKLAFFIRLRIWQREKEYGDYSESNHTFFLLDGGKRDALKKLSCKKRKKYLSDKGLCGNR